METFPILSHGASIFTAELLGIVIAIFQILILNRDHPKAFIDSLSALQALKILYSKNKSVMAVQRFLRMLLPQQIGITLYWTLSLRSDWH